MIPDSICRGVLLLLRPDALRGRASFWRGFHPELPHGGELPSKEDEIFIAEKATFNSLTDFLRTEFYRGLAVGNAPRRCHNCGKYFLLTAGYNTCYCNNIAPGETERTCRKVGAHRKEAQGKANRTPAQVEYDRAYNRLKQRKNRKKISVEEWNAAVAEAMKVLEQSEQGKLDDEEMRSRFKEF